MKTLNYTTDKDIWESAMVAMEVAITANTAPGYPVPNDTYVTDINVASGQYMLESSVMIDDEVFLSTTAKFDTLEETEEFLGTDGLMLYCVRITSGAYYVRFAMLDTPADPISVESFLSNFKDGDDKTDNIPAGWRAGRVFKKGYNHVRD